MYYSRMALEAQLAVTRLARAEQLAARGDVYDNLHDEIRQQAKDEAEAAASAAANDTDTAGDDAGDDAGGSDFDSMGNDEPSEAASDDTSEAEDEKADADDDDAAQEADADTVVDKDAPKAAQDDTDGTAADDTEGEEEGSKKDTADEAADDAANASAKVAIESFASGMETVAIALLSVNDEFKPHLLTGVNNGIYPEDISAGAVKAGGVAAKVGVQAAKVGFKYGGLALKHVYKGITRTFDGILRSFHKGNELFVRAVKNSIQSYERQSASLTDLKKAVDALNNLPDITDREVSGEYTVTGVIETLKIGDETDFTETLKPAIAFSEVYSDHLSKAIKNHLYTTQRLIETVVDQKLKVRAESLMREQMAIPGFTQETVDGYECIGNHCQSFVYKEVLPGDLKFIAYLPAGALNDREAIIGGYQAAKFFFGVASQDIETMSAVPYLSLEVLPTFIDQLLSLCEIGLKQRQSGPEIIRQRDALKKAIDRYVKYLDRGDERISIEDSQAEYIALRARSLDKTYLSGAVHLHDYQRRVIAAGIRYIEASIKAYRATSPKKDAYDEANAS